MLLAQLGHSPVCTQWSARAGATAADVDADWCLLTATLGDLLLLSCCLRCPSRRRQRLPQTQHAHATIV